MYMRTRPWELFSIARTIARTILHPATYIKHRHGSYYKALQTQPWTLPPHHNIWGNTSEDTKTDIDPTLLCE